MKNEKAEYEEKLEGQAAMERERVEWEERVVQLN